MPSPNYTITIDTGFHRPRFDACYLLIDNGRAAFIDCGINASQPLLLAALAHAGLGPDAVDHLILSHIHLDHAGGAGSLLAQLPNARVHVHPRGVRHLIDPSALVAGASAVYGADEVLATYGELQPIASARIVEANEGHRIRVGQRELLCLDAPGHARHHIVVHEPDAAAFFTGDAFGISYRELDTAAGPFIFPTTTPVQFDPPAMQASIARMLAMRPRVMHLTHYGPVTGVEGLAADLQQRIEHMVALAESLADVPDRHAALCDALRESYIGAAQQHGVTLSAELIGDVLQMDIELNAQGLGVWLDARTRRTRS
ncbi:MAG: MBL fold metallo-hydrolase [Gammaproteobacteria bacterium HGW-Gammaproteobacteria-5]|jgi:glyoxylase-like metal-dependent hydrolase (beta-lactamase superfamily II)|nr:MAG: MBL fold metallo-hydrolase [Gammaproteobacteria bacterium HGW-Gammaproteobacteria-5]